MTGAMACFTLQDMFIKWVAVGVPAGQILALMGVFGALTFAALARREGARIFAPAVLHPAVLTRNIGEMIGTLGFINALATLPLSTLSAIIQAMPLAVTFGAALFLRETVGWRRWSAIAVGFVGVLVVVRPGSDSFTPYAFWGVLTVAGLSTRDLATRFIPRNISTLQLSTWGFATVGALGALLLMISRDAVALDLRQSLIMAAALGFGIAGYWAITAAMRVGEVATVTPFRYARLVFALGISVLVFDETIDRTMLLGAGLVIGSGLYSFARERRLRRAT